MSLTHAVRRARLRTLFLLLTALMLLGLAPATVGAKPQPKTHRVAARSLSHALRADGSLRHVNGSFYARGYRMVPGPHGAPRFVKVTPATRPRGAAAHPGAAALTGSVPADVSWSENFGLSGVPDTADLLAVAVSGQNVYVGGTFTTASHDAGVVYNNVAWWDGHGWRALGTGTDATVNAIAVSGSKVYLGGKFTTAGGVPASAIAVWNGSGLAAVGGGMTNPVSGGTPSVNALAVSGTTLYAGGEFDDAGPAVAHSVAAWNGANWSPLGGGVQSCVFFDSPDHCFTAVPPTGTVNALLVSGSTLYVGGSFDYAGGHELYDLAAWNGAWSGVGGLGVSNASSQGTVNALALNGSTLYVGGHFDHVGGALTGTTVTGSVAASSVAAFDGAVWSPLGSGVQSCCGPTVTGLTYWNGRLYMAGRFDSAGGDGLPVMAQWNGSAWSGVGGLDGSFSDSAVLTTSGTGVVAVGTFLSAGAKATLLNKVGLWNGTTWSGYGLGLPFAASCCGQVYALAASNHDLYAGGMFTYAGARQAGSVAHLNAAGWSSMAGGVSGSTAQVYAIAISGSDVYVGGSFSQAGGVAASNIAMWDGTAWHALGSGVDGAVQALLVYNGKLWAGGGFTNAGGKAASELATWDLPGGGWNPVGGDPNYDFGSVDALAGVGAPYNHYVVIGGHFSYLDNGAGGSVLVNGVVMFDTNAPITGALDGYSLFPGTSSSVGVTINCFSDSCPGTVDALYADGTKVYVGGDFDDAGAVASRGFARYDLLVAPPNGWSSPGVVGGGAATVAALTKVGATLYLGGEFTSAGTGPAVDVARFTPANGAWGASLGSGMGLTGSTAPSVLALAQSSDGLYASGAFGTAGGKPSENLALWNQTAFTLRPTIAASPATAVADTPVTFTITVKNAAGSAATGVVLTDTLPTASAQYGSATPSQGSCSRAGTTLTCALGTIATGTSATVAVTLTPVAPGQLTNSVTVRQTGSALTGQTTASATVIAAAGTSYVAVRDNGFSPTSIQLTPGQKVQFDFFGPAQHSALDASPLGLFDSGLRTPIDDYVFQYTAGGTYPVHDAASAHATTVGVRDVVTPSYVLHGSPVTVRLSSVTPAAGFVLDLQVRLPGSAIWTTVKSGLTTPTATYTPAAAGIYQLRSRLRAAAGGASLFGPGATLQAT